MIQPAAALGGYVLWLLAVPMQGFLLEGLGGERELLFFLVPHCATLFAIAGSLGPGFPVVSRAAGLATGALSLVLLHTPVSPPVILGALGVVSGFLSVRVGTLLAGASRKGLSTGLGLIGGNLSLAALVMVPFPGSVKAMLAVGAVVIPALCPVTSETQAPTCAGAPDRRLLAEYLPFVFAFHMVSGLYYGGLFPAYADVASVPAVELLFYAATVAAAVWMSRRHDLLLVVGVISSMLSLALLRVGSAGFVQMSMFAMQASAGFMDTFLILFLLSGSGPVRSYALGLGVMCLGILGGKVVALLGGGAIDLVVVSGNTALTLAALLLFAFGGRTRIGGAPAPVAPPKEPRAVPTTAPPPFLISPALKARLSDMEHAVLELVLGGKTFTQVAEELGLSPSTVKTYMKRTYEKVGVSGKKKLLEKLVRPEPG